jgi:hypothetical protein
MVNTFEALAVATFVLLPGALYEWAFERQVGSWGVGLSDRVFRFFGTSAWLHVTVAPLTYWLWATYLRDGGLAAERTLPGWVWMTLVCYVAAPSLAGTWVGRATRNGRSWAGVFTGPNPAPRAWDYFFLQCPDGWIRLRLKTGTWVGGVYAPSRAGMSSYAAAYPEEQDLLLADTIEVDARSGEFLLDGDGPIFRGVSLLVRWEDVELLEFGESWR